MAKQKEQPAAPAATTLPAVVAPDFSADAGAGMEGTTRESFAIPFLSILQKSSPQCDEETGAYMPEAKAGMFINSVTRQLYDGKTGVVLIPCAYRRVFLRWGPRTGEGAGFKGELSPEEVARMRQEGQIVEQEGRLYAPLPDGSVAPKRCDRFADTRNHYVVLYDKDSGAYTQALISLTSTQIKKSKQLMSMLAAVKLRDASGGMYTPATYANLVRATSVGESNDQGSWHGWMFSPAGLVEDRAVYAAAKAFHTSVSSGAVTTNYEASNDAAPHDEKF